MFLHNEMSIKRNGNRFLMERISKIGFRKSIIHDVGENYGNTFRAEDGLLKIRYDQYDVFNEQFGHLYYKQPYSYYHLVFEYRITGEWRKDAPEYTIRNSGVMFHSQDPKDHAA
jgi:hypothetical protein